jgi:hypothetical protein
VAYFVAKAVYSPAFAGHFVSGDSEKNKRRKKQSSAIAVSTRSDA